MELILVGGGGHCKSVITCIQGTGIQVGGILDIQEKLGSLICGYKIIGTDEDILPLVQEGACFLITVGQIENVAPRVRLFEKIMAMNGNLAVVIAPTAIVSRSAIIGDGSVIMHRSCVSADVKIGSNCIINTAAIVEHDVRIGNHVHVSTGAIVNGDCIVGDRCFVGSGVVLRNNLRLCDDVFIGAGAVVVDDILQPGKYAGCPAKKM